MLLDKPIDAASYPYYNHNDDLIFKQMYDDWKCEEELYTNSQNNW